MIGDGIYISCPLNRLKVQEVTKNKCYILTRKVPIQEKCLHKMLPTFMLAYLIVM